MLVGLGAVLAIVGSFTTNGKAPVGKPEPNAENATPLDSNPGIGPLPNQGERNASTDRIPKEKTPDVTAIHESMTPAVKTPILKAPDPEAVAAELKTKLGGLDRMIAEAEEKYKRRVALGGAIGSMRDEIAVMKKDRETLAAELAEAEKAMTASKR